VLTVRDSNPGGMLKTTVSKTAADESTGGITLLIRPPKLPRQLVLHMGYVEDAFEVRTKHGKRCISARPGWAGEKSGFFSILQKTARPCVEHRGCHPTGVGSSNPSVAQG
jgi:hypothetical protein